MTTGNDLATKHLATPSATKYPRSRWALTWRGVCTVASMECRQRLRGTGWRTAIALWLVAIASTTMTITVNFGVTSNGWLFATTTAMTALAGMATAAVVATWGMARVFTGPAMSALLGTRLSPLEIVIGKLAPAWLSACALLMLALPVLIYSALFEDISAARACAAVTGLVGIFAVTAATAGGAATVLAPRTPTAVVSAGTCVLLLTAGPTCAVLLDQIASPASVSTSTMAHEESAAHSLGTAATEQPRPETATASHGTEASLPPQDAQPPSQGLPNPESTNSTVAHNDRTTGSTWAENNTEAATKPQTHLVPPSADQNTKQAQTTADRTWWLWSASPAVVLVDAIHYPQPAVTKAAATEPGEPDPLAQAKHHIRALRAGPKALQQRCRTSAPTCNNSLTSVWPYGAVVLGGVALGAIVTAAARVGRPLRRTTRATS